jgi:phytanoyl-CoA hydroxylase
MVRHPGIIAVLQHLWGPNIRFDTSKLNLKDAAGGAAVEWHQDWAFYPHTNDDLAAVGIMLDDCGLDNGPLLVIPGSHRGPVYDHHAGGRFCGAIDLSTSSLDVSRAVPLIGPAGSITVHHVRIVHGSDLNRSGRPRRILFHQYRAADAWPLRGIADFAQWEALMICGQSSIEPRLTAVPVRMPLPPSEFTGSIYENQRGLNRRAFRVVEAKGAPEGV